MIIEFDDPSLEELYSSGVTNNHSYRKLSKEIIKQYVKTINYLRSARRIEDLYLFKSLHYEKKKGDLKGSEAVWINNQYRLLFSSSPDENGIVIKITIKKITKHYEK